MTDTTKAQQWWSRLTEECEQPFVAIRYFDHLHDLADCAYQRAEEVGLLLAEWETVAKRLDALEAAHNTADATTPPEDAAPVVAHDTSSAEPRRVTADDALREVDEALVPYVMNENQRATVRAVLVGFARIAWVEGQKSERNTNSAAEPFLDALCREYARRYQDGDVMGQFGHQSLDWRVLYQHETGLQLPDWQIHDAMLARAAAAPTPTRTISRDRLYDLAEAYAGTPDGFGFSEVYREAVSIAGLTGVLVKLGYQVDEP